METTVMFKGFPEGVAQEQMVSHVMTFGEISHFHITQHARNICFVKYTNCDDLSRAIRGGKWQGYSIAASMCPGKRTQMEKLRRKAAELTTQYVYIKRTFEAVKGGLISICGGVIAPVAVKEQEAGPSLALPVNQSACTGGQRTRQMPAFQGAECRKRTDRVSPKADRKRDLSTSDSSVSSDELLKRRRANQPRSRGSEKDRKRYRRK